MINDEALTPMPEEEKTAVELKPTKPACDHQMRFSHGAHYGRFDIFKCTKCDHTELIYWE